MSKEKIIDLSLRFTQIAHEHTDYIDGDVLLSDRLNHASMPTSPRRMTFILVALCTQCECTFTVTGTWLTISSRAMTVTAC